MTKRVRLFLIIAVIALVLGVAIRIALRYFVPQTSTSQNFDQSKTRFSRISFAGIPPEVPPSLPALSVTISPLPLDQFSDAILASGKFTQNPYTDFIYHSEEGTLQILREEHIISYTRTSAGEVDEDFRSNGIQRDTAVAAATAFFEDVFLLPIDQLAVSNVHYFLSDEDPEPIEPDQARMAIITFDHTFDGIPVVTNFVGNESARAVVSDDYEVLSIKFNPLEITSTQRVNYPTYTVEQAMKQINNNNAFVANAVNLDFGRVDLSEVSQATLNGAQLEYFANTFGAQELEPYYRFWGTATNKRGQNFEIEILTPAINKEAQPIE